MQDPGNDVELTGFPREETRRSLPEGQTLRSAPSDLNCPSLISKSDTLCARRWRLGESYAGDGDTQFAEFRTWPGCRLNSHVVSQLQQVTISTRSMLYGNAPQAHEAMQTYLGLAALTCQSRDQSVQV